MQCDWTASQSANLCNSWQIVKNGLSPALIAGLDMSWVPQQRCCVLVAGCPSNSSGCHSRVVVCGSLSVPAVAATAELLQRSYCLFPQQSCCLWVTECPSSGCHSGVIVCSHSRVVVCGSLSVPAVAATAELLFVPTAELLFVGHWVSQQWLPQQSYCLFPQQSCCLWVTECPSSGCHSRVVVCGSLSVPAVAATELLFVGHWVSQQWLPQRSCCLWVTVSQQQQAVSQWQIWSDSHFCGHTERETADQTSCFTQSVYTDNRPTGPRIDTVKCNARFLEFLDTGRNLLLESGDWFLCMAYSWEAEIYFCMWLTLGKQTLLPVYDILLDSGDRYLCLLLLSRMTSNLDAKAVLSKENCAVWRCMLPSCDLDRTGKLPSCQLMWLNPTRGRCHGGWQPSSDDSLHSPTAISPSALDKPSIMKRDHRWRTMWWGVTARSLMMVTLHDTRFVECRWWNDGWTVKTVVTWRS